MFWNYEIFSKPLLFKLIGYSLSLIGGNLVYKCSYELFCDCKNLTLGSKRMIIHSLLRSKFDNLYQTLYLVVVLTALTASQEFQETVFKHSDFLMLFILTIIILILSSVSDSYKYFIRNSGLDCGSFMAYSFFHGYIKYVVASNGDTSSKGLVERMTDYEATQQVSFPIKKLLILQPASMFIPPTLKTELLQPADNLEAVEINVGGVHNRSYQLSVYKIEGPDWYVNVQGASPLITYFEECKRSNLLDKYKTEVAHSFRKHLEQLIFNDFGCRGLVEVIYYNDCDEDGNRIDVGLVLKKYIEDSLEKKAINDRAEARLD